MKSLLETTSSKMNWKLSLRELLLGPVSLNNNKIQIQRDKTIGLKINVKVAKYLDGKDINV